MRVGLSQNKRTPGAELTVRAILREYDELPVENRASVRAFLTRPNGTDATLSMNEVEPGIFETSVSADDAGLYRFRVLGEGKTLRGHRFTREWELTGSVWHRGDDPYPSVRTDPTARSEQFCETMLCLTESFEEYFEERDIDIDHVRDCLKKYCKRLRESAELKDLRHFDFEQAESSYRMTEDHGPGYTPSAPADDPELIEALNVLMRRIEGSEGNPTNP
jgi:hypothetical protein